MLRPVDGIQNSFDFLYLLIEASGHIGNLGQSVLRVLDARLDGRLGLVYLLQVRIRPLGGLLGQGLGAVFGVARIIGDLIHPIGDAGTGVVHMVQGVIHQIAQFIDFTAQLLNLIRIETQRQIRSHLSGDTAHILAALDIAVVLIST